MGDDIINELKIFEFNNKNVETIEINGEVFFNAKDVGTILGMKERNIRQRVAEMEDYERVLLRNKDINPNGTNNAFRKLHNHGEYFVTQPGLSDLIILSRKEEAKPFKKWVFKEVLPSIYNTGKYELKQQVKQLDVVELESLINTCEMLRIAKAPELSNINKQSARMKLGILISTLSHERQIGTPALYEQLHYRFAEKIGTFIPVEAMNTNKTIKTYMKTHPTLAERLYEFALIYFYQGKSVVELFNWDIEQKTLEF